MQETGAVTDFECGKVSLTGIGAVPRAYSDSPIGHTARTVFSQGKERHSIQPNQKEAWQVDAQLSASSKRKTKASQDKSWFVRARQDIILATRCRQVVTARLESEKEQKLPSLVYNKPVQIPIEGIFAARALSRVGHSVRQARELKSQQDREVVRSADSAYVILTNFSNEPLTIPKATILVVAEEASETLRDRISANAESSKNKPTKPRRMKKFRNVYDKLLQRKLDHLTPEDRQHIEPVQRKYSHVFHDEVSNDFKETKAIEHQIFVGDAKPIRRQPYRTPFALREEMQTQV